MLLKQNIKSVVSLIPYFLKVLLFQLPFFKSKVAILMYHRILSDDEIDTILEPGMYVKESTFEIHLQFLSKYFECLSIEQFFNLTHEKSKLFNRPIVVLTFDDGWFDFYKYAYPLLLKYNIPATVFLPTDYIGTKQWFWTDRLAKVLEQTIINDKNQVGEFCRLLKINTKKSSISKLLDSAIQNLKRKSPSEVEAVVKDIETRLGKNTQTEDRAFCTWEECKEMYDSGFISFGAHTASHAILTNLEEQEISNELLKSLEEIKKNELCKNDVLTFCYPNGNHNTDISEMVKKSGYSLAVTTKYGWNDIKPPDYFKLNRVGMHDDISHNKQLFFSRLIGLF